MEREKYELHTTNMNIYQALKQGQKDNVDQGGTKQMNELEAGGMLAGVKRVPVLKWNHIVVLHVFKWVGLKGVWLKLNK